MTLYSYCVPQKYYESVLDISYDTLKKQGINTLFFDLDNTVMSYDQVFIETPLVNLLKSLEKDFKLVIVSNSGYHRVSKACIPHQFKFLHSARKPLKKGFNKALKMIDGTSETSAFIGDQLMTDVLGSNKVGMYSILVKPLKKRTDHIFTRMNRRLEKVMIRKIKKHHPPIENEAIRTYAQTIHNL